MPRQFTLGAMDHSVGVAGVTAGAFLGEFAFKMFEHVCWGKLYHKVDHVLEHAARRFIMRRRS